MPETLLPLVNLAPVAVPAGAAAMPLAAGDGAMASPQAFLQALTQSLQNAEETGEFGADLPAGFAELVAQATAELSDEVVAEGGVAADGAGVMLPASGKTLPEDAALQVLNLLLPPGQAVPAATVTSGETGKVAADSELPQTLADTLGAQTRRPRAALMAALHAAANSAVANPAKLPVHDGKPADTLGALVAQAVAQVKAGTNSETAMPSTPAPVSASAPNAAVMSTAPTTQQTQGTTLPTQVLEPPVKHETWGEALGQRVQWMVGQKLQSAQLTLNPPHLGTLEVRINIQQDQAVVQFHTPHAVVREALEAALPRLREMLGDQGLQLAQANVSQQSFADQQRRAQGQAGEGAAAGPSFTAGTESDMQEGPPIRLGQGLLDTFA